MAAGAPQMPRPGEVTDKPRIFWVFGTASEVGKTGIACALLRVLAETGQATLGMKPLSALNLFASYDVLDAAPHGVIPSNDTRRLLRDSTALAGQDRDALMEVANPLRLVFFHHIRELLLVRVGAHALGNRAMYRGTGPSNALAREDVQALFKRKGWWQEMQPLPASDFSVLNAHQVFPDVAREAYEHLAQFAPDTVVCEGASRYLPYWPGHPVPDCLVVVRRGWVDLFTGIDPRIREIQSLPHTPGAADLDRFGKSLVKGSFRAVWPVVASGEIAANNERTVKNLLKQAGLPGG